METHQKLLLANRAWAREKVELRPEFFANLAKQQKPEFLWIGCSDSRVPAEEVTGAQPGEIFVHRNIANLFIHSDVNLQSVLQYAVDALKVNHVIVCGHYGCGGVNAAISHQHFGAMNKWLFFIKEIYEKHAKELDALPQDKKADRLVELSVIEQVHNLTKTDTIQKAWRTDRRPVVHGWVFGLKDGLLRDLISCGPDTQLSPIHKFDFQ